jgi:hypothetical protein
MDVWFIEIPNEFWRISLLMNFFSFTTCLARKIWNHRNISLIYFVYNSHRKISLRSNLMENFLRFYQCIAYTTFRKNSCNTTKTTCNIQPCVFKLLKYSDQCRERTSIEVGLWSLVQTIVDAFSPYIGCSHAQMKQRNLFTK